MNDLPTILANHQKWLGGDASNVKANLSGANLTEACLSRANLTEACLSRACLSRAYLARADLTEAKLAGAKGIVSFGPVGQEGRIGYAVAGPDGPRVYLGCFSGSRDETCKAIRKKYGKNSAYELLVNAACRTLA